MLNSKDQSNALTPEKKQEITKGLIEKDTGLPFDDNDAEWNTFLIKYAYIKNFKTAGYDISFTTIFIKAFILYGILTYLVSFVTFSEPNIFTSLFSQKAFLLVLSYFIFYFPLYIAMVFYILPHVITYYLLRNEINTGRILCKDIKLTLKNWRNISAFIFVVLVVVAYSLIFYAKYIVK